jgi:hypothetical protein
LTIAFRPSLLVESPAERGDENWEDEAVLGKLYALARLAAVVVAVAAAFTTIPYLAAILLILGAIAGLGVEKEDRTRLYLVAAVLVVGSKVLEGLPEVGVYLSTIFGALGTAYIGASVLAIAIGLLLSIKDGFTTAEA